MLKHIQKVTFSFVLSFIFLGFGLAQISVAQGFKQGDSKIRVWGVFDHYDVDSQYDRDGETFEFSGSSMEWSVRFLGGGSYRFAETEIADRPVRIKGVAGLSVLSRSFKFGDNSSSDDLKSSGVENLFIGAGAWSSLSDRWRAGMGARYYFDLGPDDSDVQLSDQQNAIVPRFWVSGLFGDSFTAFVSWFCAYTFAGTYDSSQFEKTNGDKASTFDAGNFQNINLGAGYTFLDNDRFKLTAGLSLHATTRSESEFGGNKFEDSNGSLRSLGIDISAEMNNGFAIKLGGSKDEYGQETGCLSLGGKNFMRPSKDFALTFTKDL